jgi:hypothetical protein
MLKYCELCGTEGQKALTCAYCGTNQIATVVTFIYGASKKESCNCEIRLTNKYLITRNVSKKELVSGTVAGAAFGLIGAAAAAAVDSARQKCYGYLDLQDIEKAIYPYHTQEAKSKTAVKLINRDGSDFVLNFNMNGALFSVKTAKTFVELLSGTGIPVENGAGTVYPVYCMKPYMNADTLGKLVCHSAATFVKMSVDQMIMPPMDTVSAPAVPSRPALCPHCGTAILGEDKFCGTCGFHLM